MPLRHLAIAALLLSLLVIVPTGALAQSGELVTGPVHINMKSGDALSVVTEPDPETAAQEKSVQAQYSGGPCGARFNAQWVTIGTWTSEGWPAIMNHSGDVYFSLWVILNENCNPSNANFRFTLRQNDEDVDTVTTSGTPQDEPTEIRVQMQDIVLDLAEDDTLEIFLEYSGFRDIKVLYDNMTLNSGFWLELNALAVFESRATIDEVTVEFYDAFGSSWSDNLQGYFVYATVDGEKVNHTGSESVETGFERTVDNRTVTSILLHLPIEAQSNSSVRVELGYELEPTIWFNLSISNDTGAIGGEDDDSLPGFELLLALPAVLFVARRRRG